MVKNALIIGASGDIGSVIAQKLASEGFQLMLHYHSNRQALDTVCSQLEQEDVLQVIQADLTKEQGIDNLLDEIAFSVDALIFANGKASMGLFQDLKNKDMNDMLMLHVKAPLMVTGKLLPSMLRRHSGKIIFITSIWGEVGASNEVLYSTLKGSQNSFVQSLAKEISGSGVTIHAVSPGFIDTKMNADLTEEERNIIFDSIALKRAGTPVEVADIVIYLLRLKSGYFNGQIIPVNGGWLV